MDEHGREFAELRQEFRDFKERQVDANNAITGRLTSIDASLSHLIPLITAHEERFKLLEHKNETACDKINGNARRIGRLEIGIVGTLVTIVMAFFTGALQYLFPPKVS